MAAVAALANASTAAGVSKPLRVLYIGDSLTNGTAARPIFASFPNLVTAGLKKRGYGVTAINVSKGGVKTDYWTSAAVPRNVDVAIVELGTNDAHEVPAPAQFETDYHHLLAMIKAKSPRARFICLSVWRPDNPPAAVSYDSVIASDCPGKYVNIDRFAHAPNLTSIDSFHPNNAGHRLIANAILYALAH